MPKTRPKKQANKQPKAVLSDMSTAEATVETLLSHGLSTIYALPGVHNDHLFDAFQRAGNRLKVVHSRHEQGCAYMALGAALATGKPQAYAVVPGPGLLNAGAALLTAYGMNAPVRGLIGQIPHGAIGRGLGHLHEIRDQAGIVKRLVDNYGYIAGPAEAPAKVAKAIRAMGTGRPGPAARGCAIAVGGEPRAGGAHPAPRPPPPRAPPPPPGPPGAAPYRRDRRAGGSQGTRQGQARPHHGRRRRTRGLGRSDALVQHAAGAGDELPARARRVGRS
jgi:acetolactate synthase-1/2/3 large subunit